jgi:putative PIN family toxin of toxin-antitoxin system
MRIVLDTNCLLPAIFSRSVYRWVWDAFRNNNFTLCYSNDILIEYEELLTQLYPPEIVRNVMLILLKSPNIELITPFYNWNLISADPDDNKFVDCALNAGANFIVTNDKHFNVLKTIPFPKIEVIDIETFKEIIFS